MLAVLRAYERQVASLIHGHGFTRTQEPQYCVGYRRRHSDGRAQLLGVFWWAKKKLGAADSRSPKAYLVVCPNLDDDQDHGARYRLPLVDWPSSKQRRRPRHEVVDEFQAVFLYAFDAPSEVGHKKLHGLDDRYLVPWPGGTAPRI